ncbi:MAG TPA: siderophore-interacting protein [Jatrophihabitantaceae bacterium]|nr:siderophore-interacting protein [Jatrophihabitantaceae bacterium]
MSAPVVRRSPVHSGTVVGATQLTPRMRRVVVRTEAMRDLSIRPAQDVELFLSESSGRRVKRRYTIRQHRPDVGEIDLDVLVHGHGPGSTWGATAKAGDVVEFQGPRGKLELLPADWHLLMGDESAIPAIASIVEALGTGARATSVIEVDGAADELPVLGEVRWVHRDGTPAGRSDLLARALDDVALPDGFGRCYLMGETRAMVALRTLAEDRGIAHDAIFVKGYWNLGRPDRIAGRAPSTE